MERDDASSPRRSVAASDARLAEERGRIEVARLETEVDVLREDLRSARQDRRLRLPVAIGALVLMVLQVVVSNAIFGWYGDTNGWDVSSAAISAWMGTTVVEVIGVVLVVMNYLFPRPPRSAT